MSPSYCGLCGPWTPSQPPESSKVPGVAHVGAVRQYVELLRRLAALADVDVSVEQERGVSRYVAEHLGADGLVRWLLAAHVVAARQHGLDLLAGDLGVAAEAADAEVGVAVHPEYGGAGGGPRTVSPFGSARRAAGGQREEQAAAARARTCWRDGMSHRPTRSERPDFKTAEDFGSSTLFETLDPPHVGDTRFALSVEISRRSYLSPLHRPNASTASRNASPAPSARTPACCA